MTPKERVKAGERAIEEMYAKLKELRLEAYVCYPNRAVVWITRPGRQISVVTSKEIKNVHV